MNRRRDLSAIIALRQVRIVGIHNVMPRATTMAVGRRLGRDRTIVAIDSNAHAQNSSELNPKKKRAPLRMKREV